MNKQKEDFDAGELANAGKLVVALDDRKRQAREIALSFSVDSFHGEMPGETKYIVTRAEEFEKYLNGGL